MFNTNGDSSFPEVFLRPRETVHVPFKFQTFQADHSVPEQVNHNTPVDCSMTSITNFLSRLVMESIGGSWLAEVDWGNLIGRNGLEEVDWRKLIGGSWLEEEIGGSWLEEADWGKLIGGSWLEEVDWRKMIGERWLEKDDWRKLNPEWRNGQSCNKTVRTWCEKSHFTQASNYDGWSVELSVHPPFPQFRVFPTQITYL